jgi:preflagellin peptidase FlaK
MDIYRVVFALFILAYACYSDIRTRSVSNIVWLVMLGVGIVFAGYYAAVLGMPFFIPLVISLVISGVVSFIFFRLGFFSAADAKAIICIALLFPAHAEFSILSRNFPLLDTSVTGVFPLALIVLLNAVFIALLVPASLFFRNLRNLGLQELVRNTGICFVAYRVKIDDLMDVRFARLTHEFVEINGGHLKRRYSLGGTPINSKTVQQLKAYHGEQKVGAEVWVTPELPFILFISLGFLACCLLGV